MLIETLESRRLLSGSAAAAKQPSSSASLPLLSLSAQQVQVILAQAISQALPGQAAVVVDREGIVLGTLAGSGVGTGAAADSILFDATARARTAAAFESNGEAFTTRTARFIIQDNFPYPIKNTPGGPLYGVQFSSLAGSDVLLDSQTPAITGDPGGIPLYVDGVAVGAIGVAGDGQDVAARADLLPAAGTTPAYNSNPQRKVFNGHEEKDQDEAVAQAGAKGYLPPARIRATNVFINGLQLPFAAEAPAHGKASQSFSTLISSGQAVQQGTIIAGEPEKIDSSQQTIDTFGAPGLVRDRSKYVLDPVTGLPTTVEKTDPQSSDPIVGSQDGLADGLTASDVTTIIKQAVQTALHTRAGIRNASLNAVVHVAVVDTQGNVLGAFRMGDGTNFSYDVAVQKARTANFFSDDTHAFSTRAIGFMSQKFFPPGIVSEKTTGPLYHLQNSLDQVDANGQTTSVLLPRLATPIPRVGDSAASLADGITIFPGGIPLYKDGHLVGAIGVSGDGVDQDDYIAYGGTNNYRPAAGIRSDELGASQVSQFIASRANDITTALGLSYQPNITGLNRGLADLNLPYVKFPREPNL